MLIKPFAAIRPREDVAAQVAALPYDVYDRTEARRAVEGKPLSFLNIDRPETQFAPDADMYAPEVYAKARELFDARVEDGTFVCDEAPCFYLYELEMDGRVQTGIVACCLIDDYLNGTIKKHENTLEAKERDRISHIDALDAQTGPIFLAYRDNAQVAQLVEQARSQEPLYDFVADDGVAHRAWRIGAPADVEALAQAFAGVPAAYVADGHHRTASAVKVGLARRAEHPDYDGSEEFNYFLSVLFPASELAILPYNRVVHDLNGLTVEEFLARVQDTFEVLHKQSQLLDPVDKGAVGMYVDGEWYGLGVLPELENDDPVAGLDVAILQERVLGPVLGIDDPRTDPRVEFVGGIRGLHALEHRVMLADESAREAGTLKERGPAVAFAMFPTSIDELMAVADAERLMPPKSTWFEPKLRSGLFIHRLDD
ncbi:DUF1015 domain-containing protein [Slackia equolifaciens]|uniref:DUF1015 domain-containing protein n=1 Tax=Slackia equolifaciens TaxID=498718 RepID=A0A3N0AW05_9ACTN|nr:DUF1015 family protein [Slackia equolifaciens]RNL39062.1 DUF1015 domain-containing protein [Slackia equolifaciens]